MALKRAVADHRAVHGPSPVKSKSEITIRSAEELSHLHLRNLDGQLLKPKSTRIEANGVVNSYSGLAPGVYHVQAGLPGETSDGQFVSLLLDERRRVDTRPPDAEGSRFADEVVDRAGLEKRMTNGCTFCNAASKAAKTRAPPHCCRSSATPPSEGARTPTILDGLRVSVFEPKSLLPRDASCGLQVLLGTDLGNRPVANAFARGVALRFWRLGTPLVRSEPLIESYQISGLGAFNRKAATGRYWLAVAPRIRRKSSYR